MRQVDPSIPTYVSYYYRGLFTVVDRVAYTEQALAESFVDEFSKQITPVVAQALERPIGYLKAKHGEFEIAQYLNDGCIWVIDNAVYMKFHVRLYIYGSTTYCRCFRDDGKTIDPRATAPEDRKHLHFEMLDTLSDDLKRIVFGHLIKRAEKAETEERRQKALETYDYFLKKERFDDWIPYLRGFLPPQ